MHLFWKRKNVLESPSTRHRFEINLVVQVIVKRSKQMIISCASEAKLPTRHPKVFEAWHWWCVCGLALSMKIMMLFNSGCDYVITSLLFAVVHSTVGQSSKLTI